MARFATKEVALAAKALLEKQLFNPGQPLWLKNIDLDTDDHGYYLATKIKDRKAYTEASINISTSIDVNGFKVKNCIILLG